MKKITLCVFILFVAETGYGQFYESSGFFTSSEAGLFSFNTDRNGNCFAAISERMSPGCTMCGWYRRLKWFGPTVNGSFNLPECYPHVTMSCDALGNVYAFGTFTTIQFTPVIFGVAMNTTQNVKALIRIGNPSWARLIIANMISVNDSGYCFTLKNDSITLYSPAGVLLWSRAGGGSQIYANDNLSYLLRNAAGLTKYNSNGTIAWQSPLNGAFTVAGHHRIMIKQGSTVYELDPSNGQVVSSHAAASMGTIFDNDGNGYVVAGNELTKYDTTGMVWQTHITGADFANISFDKHNNLYFANDYNRYVNHNGTYESNTLRVPPSIYIVPPLPVGTPSTDNGSFYGKINQQSNLHVKITTGAVKALCKESVTLVPFTVNQFIFGFENGFKVELSDATGSFTNPLVIGTGLASPIACNIPFFNPSGNKYRIRVVSETPQVTGKDVKVEFAFAPHPVISSPSRYYNTLQGSFQFCSPAVLIIGPGNYSYQWLRRLWGESKYSSYPGYNDTISINSASGDYYTVLATDTATGCQAQAEEIYMWTGSGNVKPDFYLPDTLCLNEAPFELTKSLGGTFSGDHVSENKFYPDSAGPGLHAIDWQSSNPPSCFTAADTTKYVYVDSCFRPIWDVRMTPAKKNYCASDTIVVSFQYDAAVFGPGNNFKVQLGDRYSDGYFYADFTLGSQATSPITMVLPDYFHGDDLRIRVISTNPSVKPAYNMEGIFGTGIYAGAEISVNGYAANCTIINSVLSVGGSSGGDHVSYNWHINNQVITDSTTGSWLLTKKSGDYSAVVITSHGCISYTDTVHVGNTLNIPQYTLTPPSGNICSGDSLPVTLNTDSTNLIQWFWYNNPVNTTDPYHIKAVKGFGLQLTSASGCYFNKSNVLDITVKNLPSSTISVSGPLTFCDGGQVVLSVNSSNGNSYQWQKNGSNVSNGKTSAYTANASGIYSVTVTNSAGCSNSSSITVTEIPLPPASITAGGPLSFCAGGSVLLIADTGIGYTYKWKKNGNYIASATGVNYTATTAGNYKVEVTVAPGCSSLSAAAVVTVPCRDGGSDLLNETSFNVFVSPNPSGGDFEFEFSNTQEEVISIGIFDLTGKSILVAQTSERSFTFCGKNLNAGVYAAVIDDGKNRKVLKLVKTE